MQPSPVAMEPFDATCWDQIEPRLSELLSRQVTSAEQLEQWLVDRSEIDAACSEGEANLYINMTCDTENAEAQRAYVNYIEQVSPKLKPMSFELDKKQAALTSKFGFDQGRYLVIHRDTAVSVELFREENVPIQTELEKLSQEYQQITGAMLVEFDGEQRTLPQMGKYQESTDRSVREAAYKAVCARRMADADRISALYDAMIEKRDQLAHNAGLSSFIEYAFKGKLRFDYTPDHCRAFHEACEREVMPFCRMLDERRKAQLGVDTLFPWDLSVDPKGRPPLQPFADGRELVEKTRRVFNRLDPELGEMFARLGDGGNTQGAAGGACLDLDSRRGKAPGGYQYMRDKIREPFIFMNAAGLHGDVETMIHEAGHAFHSMLCRDEPLLHYRHAPLEFCEVASMSMELLTMPYWDEFYPSDDDLARAKRKQLEGAIGLLPWIATIDAFQLWVYAHPKHTRTDRAEHWLELEHRFGHRGHRVSWDGLKDVRTHVWQRQGHLFGAPFYYIEYGIAQVGALQLWLRSLEEGESVAIDAYKQAMRLGGSQPLPELFAAAGIEFDFGPRTVGRLVERVQAELEKIPD
ncbi:MAG: M3 family oligoendopeptidase [Planctomycetota bacterium]|nr:MAG: M3 family oligoendopeptidase [Planctomycetota bacterium]